MKFAKEVLANLKDTGKSIGLYSSDLSKKIYNYSPRVFKDYSSRSYYFWRNNKRPVPLDVALKIMTDKKLNFIEVSYFSINGGNIIKFPYEKNLNFCYIIGLILGDGCLIHTKRKNGNTYLIQISFRHKKDANIIKNLIKSLFGIVSSIYPGRGCYNLCTYSKPLVLILNKKYQIPIGKKYSSIKVPKLIFGGNKNMKKAFLKGVFVSDGNIYSYRKRKGVQLRQKSFKFLREIRELFKVININFREPYYDKANNSWLLWSCKKDLIDNFIKNLINFKIGARSSMDRALAF